MFKIDVSLKDLNNEMLSEILLVGSEKFKDTVSKEILVHTINFLKTIMRFERPLFFNRWYHFTTIFLISVLHSHLFCKHDVVALLAPYQFLQISVFPLFLNNDSRVFVDGKHTFVRHLTISVLSEVSVGCRIAQRFNICNFVLLLFVTRFVSWTC